jgi:hypothetical protein
MNAARWLRRVGAMDRAELAFRTRTAAVEKAEYLAGAWRRHRWHCSALAARLVPGPAGPLASAIERLEARDAQGAHRSLSEHFHRRVSRFPISPHALPDLAGEIRARFPRAAADAASRADRMVDGCFDLLGYRNLDFRGPGGAIDWHLDPVSGRRARRDWWARVPYLDPALGDHKVIWELNRHQHFLAFGRAAWLTGDRRYRDAFVRDLEAWMRANPPLVGINWASMLELSLRSMSWVWALHLFVEPPDGRSRNDASAPWTVDLLLALDRQLSHVERNLSLYFSPNTHLTGEALGLYVCGQALPELAGAARWAQTGRDILLRQAVEQVAPDGGHAERSTHYQRYTLDFYLLALTMARVTDDPCADRFAEAADRLASATALFADPAGRLPAIGDDDGGSLFPVGGRAPADVRDSLSHAAVLLDRPALHPDGPEEETMWLLGSQPGWIIHPNAAHVRSTPPNPSRRGIPTTTGGPSRSAALPDTGYYVSRLRPGDHVLIDGGLHGFLNGGHAHADALSLTATLGGRHLFIDPGTGTYTMSPDTRDRFRSSAMHNTLTLDGRSQSVPAGPFHWKSIANARADCWHMAAGFDFFDGRHDGYLPAVHRRRVLAMPGGPLLVVDTVTGLQAGTVHRADVHWHLAPGWRVEGDDEGFLHLEHPSSGSAWLATRGVSTEVLIGDGDGLGWHSPAYGAVEPGLTVRLSLAGTGPLRIVTLAGVGTPFDAPRLQAVPIDDADGESVAVELDGAGTRDLLLMAAPGHPIRAAGLETDARLLWLRTETGRPERAVIVDGRYATSLDSGEALDAPEKGHR